MRADVDFDEDGLALSALKDAPGQSRVCQDLMLDRRNQHFDIMLAPAGFVHDVRDIVPCKTAGNTADMARTHAQTLKQINATAAERQRKRRLDMKARGRPDTVTTDYAVIEALSFLITKGAVSTLAADADADVKSIKAGMALIVTDIRDVALDILVRREGYNRHECKVALGQRLGYRKLHAEPWFVPSLRPDRAAQDARAAEHANVNALPLLPRTT